MSERVWVGSCRKWRYETRPEAMDQLMRVRRERSEPKEKAVYRCPRCKGWHLTRKPNDHPNNNAPEVRTRKEVSV